MRTTREGYASCARALSAARTAGSVVIAMRLLVMRRMVDLRHAFRCDGSRASGARPACADTGCRAVLRKADSWGANFADREQAGLGGAGTRACAHGRGGGGAHRGGAQDPGRRARCHARGRAVPHLAPGLARRRGRRSRHLQPGDAGVQARTGPDIFSPPDPPKGPVAVDFVALCHQVSRTNTDMSSQAVFAWIGYPGYPEGDPVMKAKVLTT